MRVPRTRSEFERNLHLLRAAISSGKLSFAPGISVEALLRVRRLPNGRIDLLSVDESARLQANMMAQFWREEVADDKEGGGSRKEQNT